MYELTKKVMELTQPEKTAKPRPRMIKLYVTSAGDSSVGIPPEQTVVMIERKWLHLHKVLVDKYITKKYNRMERDHIRNAIINLFKDYFDNIDVTAYYEDECPDCFELLKDCRCSKE